MFLEGVIYLVIVDAILSWIQGPHQAPRSLTNQMTEPLYRPIHAILDPRKTGGLDLSPIILIIGLQMVIGILR